MRNTLLQYDYDEIEISNSEDVILVSDYTSKNIALYELVQEIRENDEFEDFFSLYRISDDDKLERISFSIYGTSDYWDLLLQINDINPLFDMPYSLDTLMDIAEIKWNNYSNNIYFQSPLSEKTLNENIDNCIEELKIRNEEIRYIYTIRTTKMNEFLKRLREKDYI